MSLDLKDQETRGGRLFLSFPTVWLAGLAVLWLGVQLAGIFGMPRDYRIVATIAVANLAWLGLAIWLLFRWKGVRRLPGWQRWGIRLASAAVVVVVFSSIKVVYDGDLGWKGVRWRWGESAHEKLRPIDQQQVASDWSPTPHDYPRFLGEGYWAEVEGIELETNWKKRPPKLLWRQPIGAGWSSCAVVGPYFVTQEQRGPEELVTCYRLATGKPVWSHADDARHEPTSLQGGLGGAGPRATPTIHERRIYTYGATGIANCLNAETGKVIWSRRFGPEQGFEPLLWGNSGSPLVLPDEGVVVFNVGKAVDGKSGSLVALDLLDGKTRWQSGPPVTSYASPVVATLAGTPQVVQVNESSVGGYRARDGKQLWEFSQPGQSDGGASCSQAIPLAGDRVLVSKGYSEGARLYQIAADDGDSFEAREIWNKNVLQTKLTNLLIRDGYAYGLDQAMLACVEIDSGKRQWKKRRTPRWGHGQVILVGDTILVVTEGGEGVLVECNPESFVELASYQLLSDGDVTWNNPVVSGPYLLVRNSVEAACYELELRESRED